ncbi:unnamed protein product [Dracunculus medinensis]|uniref:Peptidase_S9_N domain-containing protein n=1 Tax=Dracunculus medinensis TaxID=318479 RepID=A0A0N4U981_DRAME|nr:unnamed protein product [Dracunculus medinensis]
MNDEEKAHILMEPIYPESVKNYIIRPLKPAKLIYIISELGTNDKIVLKNYNHGHLLRNKSENTDKGGVMTGAAVYDSPFLI